MSPSVVGAVDAVKDTIEDAAAFCKGAVDAVKDTIEDASLCSRHSRRSQADSTGVRLL